ncbi:PAAR domain-containing protein [Klebsiella michiganensis]|uniref:PAAR domain-containing protein n=1 Tax=Klebsiella TaxID=570 RepID=UPI001F4FCDA6|nr:PAAR domain-containing protein [Klebsiella michiganensis]UYB59454.1 PAAR domain-containing protein [Klebsiella michiganensis]
MGIGYFLVRGDRTTCGGSIIEGCDNHSIHGQATARNGDKYICGVDKKYIILREAYLIILYMALQQLELHIAEGHVLANAIL